MSVDYDEFKKASNFALSGAGNLPSNKVIRKITNFLYAKHKIDKKDLQEEFEGYFFSQGCHLKWKPEDCQLKTFVLSVAKNFLLVFTEILERRIEREKLMCECQEEMMYSPAGSMMKIDGKWRKTEVVSHCVVDNGWTSSIKSSEERYLVREIQKHIIEYHTESKVHDVYLLLFLCEIKIDKASEMIGKSSATVDRIFKKYKDGLYQHLIDCGYSKDDIREIYNV